MSAIAMGTLTIPIEELAAISRDLEQAAPQEILAWAAESYMPKLMMATAFGPEGCTIIHMLAEIEPRVRIINLDTGYQFPETLQLRERIAERYGIEVEMVRPELDVPQYEAKNGGPLYRRDPDRCCYERKIVPLRRAIQGYDAWLSSIRRDQSPARAQAPIVGWDKKFELVKVNPLANWTKKGVWAFVEKHQIPYNPLHDQGYPSIGCQPCTFAVSDQEDERAGRWVGFNKTECGLHTQ